MPATPGTISGKAGSAQWPAIFLTAATALRSRPSGPNANGSGRSDWLGATRLLPGPSRLRRHGSADFQQNGTRSLAPGLLLDHIKKPLLFRAPFGRVKKALPLTSATGNEHPVQADVGHDDPMRQVFGKKRHQILVAIPFDFQPGRDGFR